MAACSNMRAALLCSAAILSHLLAPLPAFAQDEAVELDPVVVESKRKVATDTARPVTTIDQQEIDDRQAGTIAELIDSVPGVTLMNGSTPSGSGINIRGFGATGTYGTDQMVLIQVDGATQGSEEIYRLGTQLYTDPSLYKEVEVSRGTVGSFEYGSGVVGGMVRLKTKDASDFTGGQIGWAGRQTVEYGSNGGGLTSSSILAWQPTENAEFLAQYVWRQQGKQRDGDGDFTGAEGFELPSYLLKGKFTFGALRDQSLTLSYNDTQTSESDVPYDQFGLGGSMFGNVDRDVHTRTAVATYEWDPASPLWHLEATLTYSDQKIDSSYIDGSSPYGAAAAALGDADLEYERTALTVKNTAQFATGAFAHDLRTGFEISRRERKEAYSAPGGTDDRLALFVVDDARLGGWTFSPGIRYETQELERAADADTTNPTSYDNEALMGGFSARYAWANGFSVFGSAAYTENLPILDDFNTVAYMTQPQKARTWELGGAFERAGLVRAGDAFAIKANLYHTDLWDVTSYSGVTQVQTEGVELELAYSMASGIYADANANLSWDNSWDATGVESYWSNAAADRLRLTLGKRFDTGLDLSWEAVASAGFDRVNDGTDPTPGNVIHAVRASYVPQTGLLEGTELRVSVENLFDKDYQPRLATRDAPGRNVKFTIAKAF